MNVVNKLNLKPIINKDNFFKRLHIIEGTETFKSAAYVYDELVEILNIKMNLNAMYVVVDPFDVTKLIEYDKFVLCFISSEDEINDVVNEIMSKGEYLKGYLLNEMSIYALFNASNEMNKIIKLEARKSGYTLSKMYAAGDGEIDLSKQNTILNELKRYVSINVTINEEYAIMPEKSLLYFYGLSERKSIEVNVEKYHECSNCKKINCQYREIQ